MLACFACTSQQIPPSNMDAAEEMDLEPITPSITEEDQSSKQKKFVDDPPTDTDVAVVDTPTEADDPSLSEMENVNPDSNDPQPQTQSETVGKQQTEAVVDQKEETSPSDVEKENPVAGDSQPQTEPETLETQQEEATVDVKEETTEAAANSVETANKWIDELDLPEMEIRIVREATGGDDPHNQVDGIMFCLKGLTSRVVDKEEFLARFGFNTESVSNKVPLIKHHSQLLSESVFANKTVLERLVEELQINDHELQSLYNQHLENGKVTNDVDPEPEAVPEVTEDVKEEETDNNESNEIGDLEVILNQKEEELTTLKEENNALKETNSVQQQTLQDLRAQLAGIGNMESENKKSLKSDHSEKGHKKKGNKGKKKKDGGKGGKKKEGKHGKVEAKTSDLTKWMESVGCWDEQLHSVLMSQHVTSLAQLKVLKQEKFDKIIRVARTEKIAKVKKQKKVKAVDEMLVKFEKAWRKKTHKKPKNSTK